MLFLGKPVVMLFLDPGETQVADILSCSQEFLVINAASFITLLAVNLFRFTIQGMGYSALAVCSGVLELVGRVVLAVALVPVFGFTAVCFANPAAWILADLFLLPMYFIGMHRLKKKLVS